MAAAQRLLALAFYCHRLPQRSFFWRGRQFPLCSRCTGILLGYALGATVVACGGSLPLWMAAVPALPLLVDGTGQYRGLWESRNWIRLLTGTLFGVSLVLVVRNVVVSGYLQGRALGSILKPYLGG
jgi:uncharacterized membrane protein